VTTMDPLSLTQAKRLAPSADTLLLRATRPADLETPIGAFLRLDDGTTPAYLLESVEGGERLGRYSFLGIGPRRLLEVRDGRATIQERPVSVDRYDPDLPTTSIPAPDPLEAIRAFVPKRRVEPREGMPRFTGGAVGALAYDAVSTFEPRVPLPDADPVGTPLAAFIETDLVIVFDHLTHTLSAIASLHTGPPDLEGRYRIAEAAIFEALERTARPSAAELNGHASGGAGAAATPLGIDTSLGRDEYIHAVEVAKDAIAAGEAIQVVLARRQSFELPADPSTGRQLDGIGLYRSLRRVNPSPYLFFVRVPSFEVVGASPELLVQLDGDKLTTHPIAGTRPRGATPHEDSALEAELLADPKERAEHLMLLDLGRNDVGRVAEIGTVKVTDQFFIERYSHVMHIVSNVEGKLSSKHDSIDAMAAGFPAGTVSGAPKVRAMEIIDELEKEKRGLYAGAVGYFSAAGDMDTAIVLRTALVKDGTMYVQAGAGIVADSNPKAEQQECVNKAKALFRAAEEAKRFASAARRGQ
jgi:anthranilate synthase component 1